MKHLLLYLCISLCMLQACMTDSTTSNTSEISSAAEDATVSSSAISSNKTERDSNSSDAPLSSENNESSESSNSSSSEEKDATQYSSRIEGTTPSMPVSYERENTFDYVLQSDSSVIITSHSYRCTEEGEVKKSTFNQKLEYHPEIQELYDFSPSCVKRVFTTDSDVLESKWSYDKTVRHDPDDEYCDGVNSSEIKELSLTFMDNNTGVRHEKVSFDCWADEYLRGDKSNAYKIDCNSIYEEFLGVGWYRKISFNDTHVIMHSESAHEDFQCNNNYRTYFDADYQPDDCDQYAIELNEYNECFDELLLHHCESNSEKDKDICKRVCREFSELDACQ